ncbi:5'/3'-nucleotidase SurE [Phreatobacter sp.]|uniref:5'/3'-nucleotidase SurE n=1 Tax=Phreatobacter sp. TaxID=1966341 RepID=UPI003F72516A
MRILVTNDDGIHAPGLVTAERIARALSDDVWVVAPETDQSGVSHSLSLNDPLRLREISERHFAVKGTPTDCVIMAVKHILAGEPPDLVLSGVNRGQNVAEDITYSGTIAGAIEGTILGIKSIALSQAYGPESRHIVPYETAEAHGPGLIRTILEEGMRAGSLININFPNRSPGDVRGVQVTAQGRRDQEILTIDPRHDGRGNPYYWIAFVRNRQRVENGTDIWALSEGYISVTPLEINLTDEPMMTRLAAVFAGDRPPGG